MTDVEISRSVKLKNILEITDKLNIDRNDVELYGNYKAKLSEKVIEKKQNNKNGKLILVTAINPTPLGEGKTTIAIGLADGLAKIGEKSILALREPSLGPVFGIKGGATGGGHSQVAPMEDINLHFTGDIHAITSANNLLASLIDNHIFSGNKLNLKKITWKRCLDLNDRQLRKIECGLSGEKNMVPREDGFDISVASEIMAVLCLSKDVNDLKKRLSEMVIGYNEDNEPIKAKDLNAQGSMTVLLKDAIKPNIVQTLEHTPAIIHGGPFANIAHGCNSIVATELALKLADYTVTEAGFGSDLGAEKFLNIKCRQTKVIPDAVVCIATMKALKYHGGASKEDIFNKNITALENGCKNLFKHIENMRDKFGVNVIVAINKYKDDDKEEIEYLENKLKENDIQLSLVESWEKGGEGAIDLAKKVKEICKRDCKDKFKFTYDLKDGIKEKIEKVAKSIYGATNVVFAENCLKKIEKIEKMGYEKLPVCIAKTQYSFSDDPTNLKCDKPFDININEVILKAGAGFVVAITGKIVTMPGLPKVPAAENIDINENGEIIGIF